MIKKILKNIKEFFKPTAFGVPVTLLIAGFADAFIIPMPVTTMFIASVLLLPRKGYYYMLFVVSGTIAGAVAGYYAGWLFSEGNFRFFEPVSEKIQTIMETTNTGMFIRETINGYFTVVFGSAFTPIPAGLFSVASGLTGVNFVKFIIPMVLGQLTKYLIITVLIITIGERFSRLFKTHYARR